MNELFYLGELLTAPTHESIVCYTASFFRDTVIQREREKEHLSRKVLKTPVCELFFSVPRIFSIFRQGRFFLFFFLSSKQQLNRALRTAVTHFA